MTELPDRPQTPHARTDDHAEIRARLEAALSAHDRVHSLLEAVLSIGSDLDLTAVLRNLAEAAASLVDAKYAGLGVIAEDGHFGEFINVGLSEEEARCVPRFPQGTGLLAVPSTERRALRLNDLRNHASFRGFPEGHPVMSTFLGVPIQVRDEVFGNLYLAEKNDGGQFDENDEATVTALATAAGVAIENARLFEETRLRERWLAASTEITTRLLSGGAAGDVLGHLAQQAREMADADIAVVLLPEPRDHELIAEIADGPRAAEVVKTQLSIAETLCGDVYRNGEAMTIPDLRQVNCPMLSHHGFRPGMLVPFGTTAHTRGVLLLGKSGARAAPFDDATRRMLNAFAGQAAVALELAEARQDAERLVVLEDRDRIAKDLHDVVIQRLFASAMNLVSTLRLVNDTEAGERVRRTIDDLDGTIREIRSTVFALRQPTTEGVASLRGRILAAVENTAKTLGFHPGVRLDGPIDTSVSGKIGEQLLAVLNEGLSNVARHAHATEAHVLVSIDARVTLRITDNGVGATGHRPGSGLRNMAERAQALGGEFAVEPREVSGTVLRWCVPRGNPDDGTAAAH
ncbi:signal transduction histidine kinase [Lipingzhangella halophila]|uniref:Signal transduction histidine kinase n=1 Tax=Lipingzhangella halophila TaxID=1783352 RepID=A0A7W7RNA5_9ACTN|nr:GAF domain-containing protein [Lipingzhangella halophila]MBB4935110.1 signal transduction histidine kinase [Lipingzhangella halophila]